MQFRYINIFFNVYLFFIFLNVATSHGGSLFYLAQIACIHIFINGFLLYCFSFSLVTYFSFGGGGNKSFFLFSPCQSGLSQIVALTV